MYRWEATSNFDSEVCIMIAFISFAHPCYIIRFLDGFVSFIESGPNFQDFCGLRNRVRFLVSSN